MWFFAILIAAAAIYFGAHEVALAQATNNPKRYSSFPRAVNSGHFDGYELHDVVQLAGGKLQDRLLHSHCADDRVRWRRNLKRDIEYGLRDGLYFEPTRVSDKLLSTILPNWKIRRAAVRFRWHVAPFQVPVPQRRLPPPWSVEETDACFIVGGRFVVKRAASPSRSC